MPAKQKFKDFDAENFLSGAGLGKVLLDLGKGERVFSQGDKGNAVFYILTGTVRLVVVSTAGKEATVALLGRGHFVGQECMLAGNPTRAASAIAQDPCSLMRIERKRMQRVMREEHEFADMFMAYLLERNSQVQEDLVDQLFNSSEKRLARALLLMANFGKDKKPDTVITKVSQETLAEMIGTTRSRVNFFMNRFRRLGFIEYNGTLKVHASLLNIILHD